MLCNCIISRVITPTIISGTTALIAFSPLADSSMAPPISMRIARRQLGAQLVELRVDLRRHGRRRLIVVARSARTVMVGRRSRRQMMPSSSTGSSFATWASGIHGVPLAGTDVEVGQPVRARPRSPRRRARQTTSINWSPSRILRQRRRRSASACRACATSWLETPSARARSWSISTRTLLAFSFQSRFTLLHVGIGAHHRRPPRRRCRAASSRSSPMTRNCTG